MRKIVYFICIIAITSCHKGIYISIFNKTNNITTVCCYYNYHRSDSLYLHPNDSSRLLFYTSPFLSWKKIPSLYVSYIDSLKIQTNSKTVLYRNKEFIYNLLINNKDTANMIETKVHLPYPKYKSPPAYQDFQLSFPDMI